MHYSAPKNNKALEDVFTKLKNYSKKFKRGIFCEWRLHQNRLLKSNVLAHVNRTIYPTADMLFIPHQVKCVGSKITMNMTFCGNTNQSQFPTGNLTL